MTAFCGRYRLPVLFCMVAALPGAALQAQDPVTNLDGFRLLARSIGAQVRQAFPLGAESRVRLTVLPADLAWTIDGGLAGAFADLPATGPFTHHLRAGIRSAAAEYGPPEASGLLGERRVRRTLRLILSVECRAEGEEDGAPLLRADFADSSADEIAAADIDRVEHPSVSFTRGRRSPEGFLSGILEPLILIGALGIAVVLLFQVRS